MLTSDPELRGRGPGGSAARAGLPCQDWIGPEPAVPARTGSRILRRQVPDLRDRAGNQAGDLLLEDHRSPVRARAARPVGAHGRQEDRTDPRPRRPEGPRPRRGQHQPAPAANPGRVRLRARPGRRPLPWRASIVTDADTLPAEYFDTIRRRGAERLAHWDAPAAVVTRS